MAIFLDCTPRDGGYYNNWDFSQELIEEYLQAMQAVGVNFSEVGLRSLNNKGFKGANAYCTDDYLRGLKVPSQLSLGIMVNAAELIGKESLESVLEELFPESVETTPLRLVRIACHIHEFSEALPAVYWLKDKGFKVGFNLMQIAGRSQEQVEALGAEASKYPLDVLYFADSMGCMNPDDTVQIITWLRKSWEGALGIHTHDNLGMALQNSMTALSSGVAWIDSTITGMGRGPGNAKTEQLAIEMAEQRGSSCNLVPLLSLIKRVFKPMQDKSGWGTNTYYYLAGKYGIHPSYIQEMQGDNRYSEEDILSAIDHLKIEGGKTFNLNTLEGARHFYQGEPRGTWSPIEMFKGREVLLLGTGPGVKAHCKAIEAYISKHEPLVVALNAETGIAQELIGLRVACHPTRLLADCEAHVDLPQPLITPASMLPEDVLVSLKGKKLLDYGLCVDGETFSFGENSCVLPVSLVMAYILAVVSSGGASGVLMAGFDGYGAGDPRNQEVNELLRKYNQNQNHAKILAVTPTFYEIQKTSIYGMN